MRLKYIYYVLLLTYYRYYIEVTDTDTGDRGDVLLTIEVQRGTKHGAPGILRSAHDAVVTARARHAYNKLI